MNRPATVTGLTLLLVSGCGAWTGSGPGCRTVVGPVALPAIIDESSGVAASRARPGIYWTLNDGSDGTLYAVDATGALVDSVTPGAHAWDWEDLALAPCPSGDCLWIADTGDNYAEREQVAVYRVPEPMPGEAPGPVESFIVRFPDGPRDVEAIFVLPGERLYFISKGEESAPALYRYPPPLRPHEKVTLEGVQYLDDAPRSLPRRITGAAASADGSLVAIRTYETVSFVAFDGEGRLRNLEGGTVNLRTLREAQGEAVAFGADGEIVLTSEAGPLGGRSSLAILGCELPDPEAVPLAPGAGSERDDGPGARDPES